MENYNRYERNKKSKIELYQEKLQKRNATQDWIFGNTFGKPGGGAPLRDNQGNVVSSLKSVTENNIYKYDPADFSRGNNNITLINHKIYNTSNINQLNLSINNNQFNQNNGQQIIGNSPINTINYNNLPQQNNNIINGNKDTSNIILQNNNNISNSPKIFSPYQNLQTYPYILVLPPSLPVYPQYYNQINNAVYPNIVYENNDNQSINNININSNLNNNINSSDSYFGNDSKKKEEQKTLERQEYRNELLLQIKEKRRKDEERKRKMEEDEKLENIKNEEYFKIKRQQAEEQAKKLREKINKRMQKPLYEEMGSASNIMEISKDFENVNKSFQGESPLNNGIEEIKENENEENNESNFLNIEDENIFGDNMVLEEEHYIKKLEEEYKAFHQSLNKDIDKQINTDKNISIYNINNNLKEKEKNSLLKKQNELADYLVGNIFSPPTPIKPIKNKNNLYLSYSQKINSPPKHLLNFQNKEEIKYNTLKNKTINLEDFFNKDERKKDNNENIAKESMKSKEVQDKIENDYNIIFKDLKSAHEYTKKYSKKDDDELLENSTTSFYSSTSSNKNKKERKDNDKYNSQQKFNTRNNASILNSSLSYSNYEKDQINSNKKNKEKIKDNESDNDMIDENSVRSTGIKNISKTVLDKELINIQENKEDEEDEEDDEKNQNKESNKSDNSNKNSNIDKNSKEENNDKKEIDSNKDKDINGEDNNEGNEDEEEYEEVEEEVDG